MKYLILTLSVFAIVSINAQNNAFHGGEKLVLTASYNMSGLMTELAEVRMETSEVNTSRATLLRLKCTATTYSKWDNFFKIRDIYESYVNPNTLAPYLYQRDIDEGGHYKFVKYKFDYKTNTIKSLRLQKSNNFESGFWERKDTIKLNSGTKDLISTIYHLRTLDMHKATVGSKDSYTVLFDSIEIKITFTFLGEETINTNIGSKNCYKLAISISNSDVLKGNNSNLLWLTADENKIPVYVKFKVAVGDGELKIKSVSGLKN